MTEAGRFFRRGKTKVFFVPTLASKTAPTAVQINAGTNLTPGIASLEGFTFDNSPIPTPDMDSTFTTSIPGEDTAADSRLNFYERTPTTGNPNQAALAKGTTGNIVIFWGGIAGASPAASDKCEVWPIQSTGYRREYTVGNDPARWSVGFTPTDTPSLDSVVA